MIERIAVALHQRISISKSWSDTPAMMRMHTRSLARAALLAMRKPTEAMCIAGAHGGNATIEDSWRAMIDAALEEGE